MPNVYFNKIDLYMYSGMVCNQLWGFLTDISKTVHIYWRGREFGGDSGQDTNLQLTIALFWGNPITYHI